MRNNAKPKVTPTAGYVGINQLTFSPPAPQSIAIPVGIPKTNNGDTSLRGFSKFTALMRSPFTKKIVNTQQTRF